MKMKTQGYRFCVLLGVISYSSSSIFAGYTTAPSIVVNLYRSVAVLLVLAPFVLKNRSELKTLSKKKVLPCLGAGICFGIHIIMFVEAVQHTSVAVATILGDSEILFVAPIMHFLFKERISHGALVGILLTLTGSFIVAVFSLDSEINSLYGNLMALGDAFFVSAFTIVGRNVRSQLSNTNFTFLVYAGTLGTLLLLAAVTKTPVLGYEPVNYLTGVGLAAVSTFGGHAVFSWALRYIEAPFVSTMKLLEPFLASLFAFFFFRQIPTFSIVLGGIIVITGILIYTKKS